MNPASPVLSQNPETPELLKVTEINVAESQPQYQTITCIPIKTDEAPLTAMLSRWEFTDDERRRIAEGQSLFLEVLGGMVPVKLYVATAQEVIDFLAEPSDNQPLTISNQTS